MAVTSKAEKTSLHYLRKRTFVINFAMSAKCQ